MKHLKNHKLMTFVMLGCLYLISASILYFAISKNSVEVEQFTTTRIVLFVLVLPLLIKFLVQLVAALMYGSREASQAQANTKQPSVSVLLPAYNEEVGIIKTVESVLNSNYKNLQLVVVNDGSSDATDRLVCEFLEQNQKLSSEQSIKYLSLPNGGKAKALNRALKHATGEIIITVDADCLMEKDTVEKFVQRFNDPQVGAVAGNVIVGNKKKPIEIIQQLEYVCGFFFKRADSTFNAVHIIGGAAAAYRKEVLENLRGFDQELITEDVEMSMRILGHGYKTRYAADAVIYTEGPSDFQGLCNQRLRWKYGRILTYIKHRELFFSQNKQHNRYLSWAILPLAVYSELLLLLQGVLLTVFFSYSFISQDFLPLAIMVVFSTCLVSLQILIDSKAKFHRNLLILAPVAWMLLYVIDYVEIQALTRSLKRLFKRESLEWQKWQRVGLVEQQAIDSST